MEAAAIMEIATVTIPISADLRSHDRPRNTRPRDRRRHRRAGAFSPALAMFFKENSETLLARLCLIAVAAARVEAALVACSVVAGTLVRWHKTGAVSDCSTRTPALARQALPTAAQPVTTANTPSLVTVAMRRVLRRFRLRHLLPPTAAMGGEHKKVTTHYVCHLHNLWWFRKL